MSVMQEPKMELEEVSEPDRQELRFSPTASLDHYKFSASPAGLHSEVKDEIDEDLWEAIEDEPIAAKPLPELETKCLSQNRCDSVVTQAGGTKKRKSGTFKCETCGCFRSTNQSLQRHMRTHTDDRPFKCPICGKPFRLNCAMQDHIPTHSIDPSFICDLCDYTTKFRSAYSTHRKKHFDAVFKCAVCGKGFSVRKSYYKHVDEEHPSAVYKCDSCSFETTRRDKYSDHMKNKERGPCEQRNFVCEHCDFRTASPTNLRQHMLARKAKGHCFRGGLKPILKCAVCGFVTLWENDMQNHIDRRSNGRCIPVERREDQRRIELLSIPGRETILVHDSIPERPSKQGINEEI